MAMHDIDFRFYQEILHKYSGLHLPPEKTYLLTTRITPLCKTLGFDSLDLFTEHLRSSANQSGINMVVEAMTTNETSFFRDTKPFQYLKNSIFPYYLKARASTRKLRIWSAACSTGQEAYSIAFTLNDMADKFKDWSLNISGTDIADHVLKKARDGEFNNFEIQRGLSMPVIVKNFTQRDGNWYIKDDLKKIVDFKKFNLLDNPAKLGQFDIIFCRNVLIYFNQETKLQVLKNLYSAMPDDGILILGSCENVMSDKSKFFSIENMHGFYSKNPIQL